MHSDAPEQLPLPLGHVTARGVEDFLVATSNRLAVEWIDRWPDWPFPVLVIVGPRGSGKTHLSGLWRARADAEPIDLGRSGLEHAMQTVATGHPVLIDNCDRAAGDPEAELALLQLYNLLRAAGGQLLMTATRPPSNWPLHLPDLSSRLNSAMIVPIDPPDDALLGAVAVKLFADRQLRVSKRVILYLLSHGERSFAGIARAVDSLDRASLAGRREITEHLARDVLGWTERKDFPLR